MSKHKKLSKSVAVLSMISNLLIFGLVVVGVVIGILEKQGQPDWYFFFLYFTTISNLLLGVSSFVMALHSAIAINTNKLPKAVTIFKFVTTVCTTLTLATVFIVFGLIMQADFLYLISGSNLFFHLVIPVLGLRPRNLYL